MIELKNISKEYKVSKRKAGIVNALKSFFKKEYETVHALDGISFSIKEGEMVGYIGPNRCWKIYYYKSYVWNSYSRAR